MTVYEKGPWRQSAAYGEWQTRTGDIHIEGGHGRAAAAGCQGLDLIGGEGDRRAVAEDGAIVVRALDRVDRALRG